MGPKKRTPIKFAFRKLKEKILTPTPANKAPKKIVPNKTSPTKSKLCAYKSKNKITKRTHLFGGRRRKRLPKKSAKMPPNLPYLANATEPCMALAISILSIQEPYPEECMEELQSTALSCTSSSPNVNQIEPIPGASRVLSEVILLNESPKEASTGSEIKVASIKKAYVLIDRTSPELTSVQVKCPYNPCPVIKNGLEIMLHLEVCEFRPVICNEFIKTCCNKVPVAFSEYEEHLKTQHLISYNEVSFNMRVLNTLRAKTFVPGTIWAKTILVLENKRYLLNKEIHGETLYMWISYLGSEAEIELKKSCYTIFIYRTNDENTFYIWKNLRFYSHQMTLEKVRARGDCANINVKNLESFCFISKNDRQSFEIGFEIIRIENEVINNEEANEAINLIKIVDE